MPDTILATHPTPRSPGTCAGRFILVKRDHGYHPYVSWWENTDLGGRHWGHYFATEEEAQSDFKQRIKRGI